MLLIVYVKRTRSFYVKWIQALYTFVLLLLLLLCLQGDAIKCYSCNTLLGPGSANCGDPFKSSGVVNMTCTDGCMKADGDEYIQHARID